VRSRGAFLGEGRGRAWAALRRLFPTALLFSAFATLAAGFLASSYERSSPYPFTAMLPATLGVILLARASSASRTVAAPWRALRGLAAFAAVFAVAFLMLDRMDPTYLAGFGL
jgi:phosphoglycerol transferase MdoB-like AlkP superfamily enzyme